MKTVFLSSAYLAPVEYYTKLLAYDKVFIEQHDHYMKQTYRNRCTIAAPDGELALSIPTVKPNTLKCPMRDIRISDHGNWRHLHWNAIESAYNHTPFLSIIKTISVLSTKRSMNSWPTSMKNFAVSSVP